MLALEHDTPRDWDALRVEIGAKVRVLRSERRWTQKELAQRLGLSQARLSEIERGLGSFSAEHLLELFRLFNVDAAHFASAPQDETTQLQNALAKLGATHLMETEHVLPSDRVTEVNDVLFEVLVDGANPRHLSALAPVFVACVDDIRLDVIASRLDRLGLAHRLGWAVDNTLAALGKLDSTSAPIRSRQQRRRAEVVLGSWLEGAKARKRAATTLDVLDPTIRSEATLKEVQRTRSAVSKRWGVVSVLAVNDFAAALEGAA